MVLTLVGYGSAGTETEPIAEPITLKQAKQQTRRDHVNDDDAFFVETLIPAARERAEQATQRQLITTVYQLKLDCFPGADGRITLPLPPLQSVTSITYVDVNGTSQTLASSSYVVTAPAGPRAQRGYIEPAYGEYWPSTRDQSNAVTIRFVAGYGDDPEDVPPRLKVAMLQDLSTMYEYREDMVIGQGYSLTEFPFGSRQIYRSFKSHG